MADEEKKPVETPAEPKDTQKPAGKGDGKTPAGKEEIKESKLKLFMSSLTPRERSFLSISGVILAVLMIDLMVVRPIGRNLDRVIGRIGESKAIIPKRLMILRHRDKVIEQYGSLLPYMTESSKSREEEITQLLRDIERVSKESGLFISNINPVTVEGDGEDQYRLLVDIEGQGVIQHLLKYIQILEKSNPSIRVGNFHFTLKKKTSDDLEYSLSIIKLGVKKQWAVEPDSEKSGPAVRPEGFETAV